MSGAGDLSAKEGESTPPRVVAAWASGPFEVRVAFDRPVDPETPAWASGQSIGFGARPERLQAAAVAADSRDSIRVAAARLDDDGRTLVLTTDPHPMAATYRVDLRVGPGDPVAVQYRLDGVEAVREEDGSPTTTGWWPSFNPTFVLKSLRGSAPGDRLAKAWGRPGRFVLTTLVDLPPGPSTLRVESARSFAATLNGEGPAGVSGAGKPAVFRVEAGGEPALLTVTLPTQGDGSGPSPLTVGFQTDEVVDPLSSEIRPYPFRLPWVPTTPPTPAPLGFTPDLAGGDLARGASVFVSAEARCATCHRVRGVGGVIGPDLSDLVGHDRVEVYRDILEPSARIHPGFVPYTLAMKDGRVVVGIVRSEGANALKVTDAEAKVTVLPRAEVEEFRPSATSVMPVGLVGAVGEAKVRDLVAFLTTAGPPPPPAPATK